MRSTSLYRRPAVPIHFPGRRPSRPRITRPRECRSGSIVVQRRRHGDVKRRPLRPHYLVSNWQSTVCDEQALHH
ncbi:hypothetical protein EJB05_43898 [Eragrostis curvula]|uniref:Uncharacterized protein n=1 Tax=Eragrostis curvula TaxID=38414 RepID=A0A5J9TG33_9POAL|nr:hypothetical protein EJB05_43898 [Eragrostis curvula]